MNVGVLHHRCTSLDRNISITSAVLLRMQYLSKAYSYCEPYRIPCATALFYEVLSLMISLLPADSGINPATLSGAIDVIVIRHIDDRGDVILSSSPFHVRFGKLQVLRAGEKRVTLRLPNNLPPPHMAPFSMKVGDAGEAFFVLETEDEVPEELLTSPVILATDVSAS